MKKVLVTGAGGFIGSHLTEYLIEKGLSIKAFVRYNSKNSWGWLEESKFKNEIEFVTGDIRDYDSVYNAVKGTSAVFHLAALIGIPYSYVSPKAYIETNITGTYNILQAVKELGVEQTLITSTSETYGSAQYVPIDEGHPLVGQSPYSATKIAADQLGVSYYRSFQTPLKIVRPFNTFGPRQSARAVIPTIISQVLSGKKLISLGSLTPTRDLTFVKDTCNGFFEIYKSDELFGEVTNIGMNTEISIGDLFDLIVSITGSDARILPSDERIRPAKSEVERLWCNNSKIMQATDWRPHYTLKSGLEETINFIQNKLSLYKPEVYNV